MVLMSKNIELGLGVCVLTLIWSLDNMEDY